MLIAVASMPAPERDGAQWMWRLIRAFRGLGCAVTVLPAAGDAADADAARLEAEGVEVLRRLADERELAAIGPALDLAVLSGPHVASRYVHVLRELAPAARIACDGVDPHHLRELCCCDVTLVATDEQREDILAAARDADVAVVPTSHEERVAPRLRALLAAQPSR